MRVENVNNNVADMKTGMSQGQGVDATTKNLQNQILAKQQELKKLSENQDMTMEAKMKKRQEINQQIADLNRQLRQHEIEQRKEKQKEEESMNDMFGGDAANNVAEQQAQTNAGLSDTSVKAMIAADASMKMSDVEGSVSASMERRASVLKAEIKQDEMRGVSVEKKKQELADIEEKALNASKGQMKELKGAHKSIKNARKDAIKDAAKDKMSNSNKNLKKSENTNNAFTSNTTVIFQDKDSSVSLISAGNNNSSNKINDAGVNIIV